MMTADDKAVELRRNLGLTHDWLEERGLRFHAGNVEAAIAALAQPAEQVSEDAGLCPMCDDEGEVTTGEGHVQRCSCQDAPPLPAANVQPLPDDVRTVVERLRRTRPLRLRNYKSDAVELINPDGPEAAALLERYARQRAKP